MPYGFNKETMWSNSPGVPRIVLWLFLVGRRSMGGVLTYGRTTLALCRGCALRQHPLPPQGIRIGPVYRYKQHIIYYCHIHKPPQT